MLCIYYPLSDAVNKGNISDCERMILLESYSKCMRFNFKEISKEAAARRKHLQDILFNNLCYKSSCVLPSIFREFDHIVYDLCGYLLHARAKLIGKLTNNCQNCQISLETKKELLPKDFYAGKLVEIRERFGGLKYCTPQMFSLFSEVEKAIQEHFHTEDAYVRDSFTLVMEKLSKLTLPEIGCNLHRETLVPRLIYEYVVIRYRFQAKQEKKQRLEKSKSARKGKRKLSKMAVAPSAKKLKTSGNSKGENKEISAIRVENVLPPPTETTTAAQKPVKKRGRPAKKTPAVIEIGLSSSLETTKIPVISTPVPMKKRGRPPKKNTALMEISLPSANGTTDIPVPSETVPLKKRSRPPKKPKSCEKEN